MNNNNMQVIFFSGDQDLPEEEDVGDLQLQTVLPPAGHAGPHLPEHL